jgi:RNA polymerase sigma-70 factor, ECF subfamily
VVRRAQQGDPDAFRCLYRDIQPRLLRYLHALAGDDAARPRSPSPPRT